VSAALLHRFRSVPSLRYWKPVETGIETDNDTATVLALSGAPADRALAQGIRLPRPLSPHQSAELAGQPISIPGITSFLPDQPPQGRWIVEGAGGVLVPLNERALMVDLILALGLPAVIAARSGLGTINHTLLTIEALRARAVTVAGVVMVGPPHDENQASVERYGHVAVVGRLPALEPLTASALQACADTFDPTGVLTACFL
jgi:dethiobiotin synthetase